MPPHSLTQRERHAGLVPESSTATAPLPLVSVPSDMAAVDAFATMEKKGVSGAAVVDSMTGCLAGNVSESDLRGLSAGEGA